MKAARLASLMLPKYQPANTPGRLRPVTCARHSAQGRRCLVFWGFGMIDRHQIFAAGVGLVLAVAFFIADVAYGQVACGPSISVLLGIDRFGEVEQEMFTQHHEGEEIQWIMWLNEATGSWTLTATHGALTCVIDGAHSGYKGQKIADYVKGPAL